MVRTVLTERQTSDFILVLVEFTCILDPSLVEKQYDVFVKVMQLKIKQGVLIFFFVFYIYDTRN